MAPSSQLEPTIQSVAPIQQRLMTYVRRRFGENGYSLAKLVGDASSRQYYRLVENSGSSWILAAYPEPFDPERFTYQQVYGVLQQIGLPVPELFEIDGRLGVVLQEDLGSESLQKRLVSCSDAQRRRLLEEAVSHIAVIQEKGTPALQPHYEASQLAFDQPKLRWELQFFQRHYMGNYRSLHPSWERRLEDEFDRLALQLADRPRMLCHRDYHVRNLMCRHGRLYIIDFQDARRGPLTYDLVSLLKDSIDLPQREVDALIDLYRDLSPQPFADAEFEQEFHLTCVQRLLKALGTYAYQVVVRQNFIYEQYIPGTLRRAQSSLQELDTFPTVRRLVEQELDQSAADLP